MNKHKHAEAFCKMRYEGTGQAGSIRVTIWNSRDGVTPFITVAKQFGIELQHAAFRHDEYLPNYKPVKGDLIWRDYTEDEAREVGELRYDSAVKDYERLCKLSAEELAAEQYGINPLDYLSGFIALGKDWCIADAMRNLIELRQPKLELVTKDWV